MKKSAHKINATTQKFIEVQDIYEDVALLPGNQAAMILEVNATNFSLQSVDEQQSKIYSYASLLNSLSFAIQILIISRKLDITSYVNLLDEEAKKTQNPKLGEQIHLYKDFVSELVQANTVLDKKIYIVIPFSFLEKGAGGIANTKDHKAFVNDARNVLRSKAQSVSQELLRVGLKSKILSKDELVSLYYEVYNSEKTQSSSHEINSTMVKGQSI